MYVGTILVDVLKRQYHLLLFPAAVEKSSLVFGIAKIYERSLPMHKLAN